LGDTCILITVGQAAHAGHDAEHVVVDGVDADLRRTLLLDRVDGQREVERGLVDTREVARAAGLVLLGLEGEGVHVDAHRRRAGVVLPGLHLVEVATLTLIEAVLAVELHLGDLHGVLALALDVRGEDDLGQQVVGRALEEVRVLGQASSIVDLRARRQAGTRCGTEARQVRGVHAAERTRRSTGSRREIPCGDTRGTRGERRRAVGGERAAAEDRRDDALRRPVVGVVEGLLAQGLLDPRRRGGVAVDERVTLDNPHQLLDGVVEVHLDLVRGGRDRLVARELELVNQVLVRLLGEAATLLRVEVDVVDVQRRGHQLELGDGRDTVAEAEHRRVGREQAKLVARGNISVAAVVVLLELDVDADLVVLEGDQRDGQAGVAAVPELQGDVQRLERGAGTGQARVGGLRRGTRGVQGDTSGILQQHQVGGVAYHVVERHLGAEGLGQLRPDLHPVAVLAVNTGAADLDLDLLDQAVADVVQPAEAGVRDRQVDLGQRNLDVRAVHQISVAANDSRDTAAEVSLAVEGHLNRLHGEVGVTLVQHLPEGNLGVTRDVDVLGTVRDELHKSTSHCCLCSLLTLFFSREQRHGGFPLAPCVGLQCIFFSTITENGKRVPIPHVECPDQYVPTLDHCHPRYDLRVSVIVVRSVLGSGDS